MSASSEALARWWHHLSNADRASLRRAAQTGTLDERARALVGGKGALWAVYDTYFHRDKRSRGARLAENVRQFVLRQGERPGQ